MEVLLLAVVVFAAIVTWAFQTTQAAAKTASDEMQIEYLQRRKEVLEKRLRRERREKRREQRKLEKELDELDDLEERQYATPEEEFKDFLRILKDCRDLKDVKNATEIEQFLRNHPANPHPGTVPQVS